jgi:peptidylprolyl isomerase domain and WD repeat-containing protein 1
VAAKKVVRVLGGVESTERFLAIALYQGVSTESSQILISRKSQKQNVARSEGGGGEKEADPTVFCASFRSDRFYLFSRREPPEDGGRDIFNEKPRLGDRVATLDAAKTQSVIGSKAIMRTTMGDIHMQLFGDKCPRAVENFCVHSRNGYYDNIIFHRVIKGFMIQTGDPLGDGTGGTSIWGKEFEDEFHRSLRHDRPFTVSMANAGPRTNGSQFFITTNKTPWLDNKHTVFGRVTSGMDVVTQIENAKVSKKTDKPLQDIRILNIEISQ